MEPPPTVREQRTGEEDSIRVLDPSTGEPIGSIPAGSPETVDAAVRAARAAQPAWARRAPAERAELLKDAARRLREHVEELAELQSREGGKPLADSRGGVEAGIGAIEQYAELGPLHRGRSLAGSFAATDVMIHEPRGVVALLVPWNDPVAIACQGLAACLVTGNAVVFKPSEKTPLSGIRLAELMAMPDGVLSLLLGDERAGRPLVAHPGVDLVVHIGSVRTGREIARTCGEALKKAVVELGGKDPLIVDAGVDPTWAAEQAASGAFANAGQICTSVERIYVHEAVADAFVSALVDRARDTDIGPLIDHDQRALVDEHVREAADHGARVLCGGEAPDGPGFFYPPTVVVDIPRDTPLMRDETFGQWRRYGWSAASTPRSRRNDSEYGLAATVLTPSQEHAQLAARELRAGTVKINAVWGGAPGGSAQPRSGVGFGHGPELLDEVTFTKVVHVEPAPEP